MNEVGEINNFVETVETAISGRDEIWKSGADEKGRRGSKKKIESFEMKKNW